LLILISWVHFCCFMNINIKLEVFEK
jgi:hypothetical protein